ncbi:MAG: copper homeostasis membrane protein CopD [Alteraurantiacibacter sp.]
MPDAPIIAARFGLFAIAGLQFGVPLFGLYALRAPERNQLPFRAWLILLGLGATLVNILGFALIVARMSGTSLNALDPELTRFILFTAPVGWAFCLRLAATVLALGIAVLAPPNRTWLLAAIAALNAVAVASLAWNGHGAAGEGALAWPHLIADIVHLLAAGVWLGAIVCLLYLVVRPRPSFADLTLAARCLKNFGTVGTLVVALLVVTGLINGVAILGDKPFGPGLVSGYLVLMAIKLALFGLMLALAAWHRFRLVPQFERSTGQADMAIALRRFRLSMVSELLAAVAILALVAWLGTLEPAW